jgi:hypothetical protein
VVIELQWYILGCVAMWVSGFAFRSAYDAWQRRKVIRTLQEWQQ